VRVIALNGYWLSHTAGTCRAKRSEPYPVQVGTGVPDDLPSAADTERGHDRGHDQVRPRGSGAEDACRRRKHGEVAIASLREQIHTERMFASPVRKR
jgi:hypothetical protein